MKKQHLHFLWGGFEGPVWDPKVSSFVSKMWVLKWRLSDPKFGPQIMIFGLKCWIQKLTCLDLRIQHFGSKFWIQELEMLDPTFGSKHPIWGIQILIRWASSPPAPKIFKSVKRDIKGSFILEPPPFGMILVEILHAPFSCIVVEQYSSVVA